MPYQADGISAPWLGWKDDLPSMVSPSNSFKSITNAIINKGRLYAFPAVTGFNATPDNNPLVLMRSFIDILGNIHTFVATTNNAYYLNADHTYNLLNAYSTPLPFYPLASEEMTNKLFLTGPQNIALDYVNGEQSYTSVTGQAAYFLGKLGSRLIMANTIEPPSNVSGSVPFPYRVRWSKFGDPTNWTDITAGAKDIVEVEDQITGFATLSNSGYIFRSNGISVMTPTGNFQLPFVFDNYSIGEVGVGNAIVGSLATFGEMAMFVGVDDIYQMYGGTMPSRVGSSAKKSIFTDLQQAIGPVTASFISFLVPGIDYLSYWLSIPLTSTITSCWVWHLDDNTWVNERLPYGTIQFLRAVAIG